MFLSRSDTMLNGTKKDIEDDLYEKDDYSIEYSSLYIGFRTQYTW